MANKITGPVDGPVLATIEQWHIKKKLPAAVHLGAIVRAGWSAGKAVTEAEYDAAVADYLKSPAGRSGKRVK